MKHSIRHLYRELLDAHTQGLIYVQTRGFSPLTKLEIIFHHTVKVSARDKLAAHIQKTYNVQLWWQNVDILHIQAMTHEAQ